MDIYGFPNQHTDSLSYGDDVTNSYPDIHCYLYVDANSHPFRDDDIYPDSNSASFRDAHARFACLLFRHAERIAAI